MKKLILIIPIFLILSCSHDYTRYISITNKDTTERTVKVLRNDFGSYTEYATLTLQPNQKEIITILGGFKIETTQPTRCEVMWEDRNTAYIKRITPDDYNFLNQLQCQITIKDKENTDFILTVNSGESATSKLYKSETHDFYIDGSKTENGFTYVEYQDASGNTKKAWFTIVEDQTKIIVKNP